MEAGCPICGLELETSMRCLWDCPSARDAWAVGPKKFHKSSTEGTDFRQVMEEMCNTCSEEELQFFTGLARKLWFRRNE